MKRSCVLLTVLLALPAAVPAVHAQKPASRGAGGGAFDGWSDALTLESRDNGAKAVVVPGIGGRVMFYGLGGDNVLWVNPDAAGRNLASAGPGFEPGGFQGDVGPEVAGLPSHPEFWAGPYTVSNRKNKVLSFKSPEDKSLDVEMEKEILLDPTSGDLGFLHRIKNKGERDAAYCLWHRIACRPGGYVLLPLNKKSRFAAGWSMQRNADGRLSYDGAKPEVPSVRAMDGVLVAKTGGSAAKIGADSDAQWVAYVTGRVMLVVHFPIYSTATYSEGGNSVTVAWDERRTELQPLSPEARLKQRKSYEFPLKWSLIPIAAEPASHEEARALAEKVPGSPFQ